MCPDGWSFPYFFCSPSFPDRGPYRAGHYFLLSFRVASWDGRFSAKFPSVLSGLAVYQPEILCGQPDRNFPFFSSLGWVGFSPGKSPGRGSYPRLGCRRSPDRTGLCTGFQGRFHHRWSGHPRVPEPEILQCFGGDHQFPVQFYPDAVGSFLPGADSSAVQHDDVLCDLQIYQYLRGGVRFQEKRPDHYRTAGKYQYPDHS